MRRALFSFLALTLCALCGAQAAARWTESFKQGIGEFMIRNGGATFYIACPSGLEKTNPGFSFTAKKLRIAEGITRSLEVQLVMDRLNHPYAAECSGDQCEWTSTNAQTQGRLEQSIRQLRSAKAFTVQIPELGISERFSISGARKVLENALEGCES